jgi:nucleoside-diphosphate-sugar epimerase
MRVFVTGASGFIGSAVLPELIAEGHEVTGLARSENAATAVKAAGAQVLRGDLAELDVLREGARNADGVIHLAFGHDFAQIEKAVTEDRAAIELFGEVLADGPAGQPLVIASGLLGLTSGQLAKEDDEFPVTPDPFGARNDNARVALALADRGVRASSVRLAPTVHRADHLGFVGVLADIARRTGVSGYPGEGDARWPAVHVQDAARLFRLALDKAPAGSVLHGADEEGNTIRTYAEVIGRRLDLPVRPIPDDQLWEHFSWLAPMLTRDVPTASAITRELLGWQPTQPQMLDDMENSPALG